ncbi:FUSC family protein [Rhabdochromatium marinum]|uniref:FUSC family protein n=1 Tax=Rhabdochromatium marinum TaxID=48729 RepID=UPI00190623F0|nr:FUSC family protein [Rhabdochromatium marinum]MBK1648552.1 fusaric acid resistance protein [Rhabdochromatium marinum]
MPSFFTGANALFSIKSFVAAMLALYLAMRIGLERPYWSIMTVYIVSQPLAAAVRSKAIYRFLGTFLGAVGAVLMIPKLVHAPVLLSLAMSLWVGACLAISMLDRSPRSYVFMLAGYTVAMIGFPAVNHPGGIFDIAAARVQEILLGISCATLVHSLWFPRPVGEALRARLGAWLEGADQWALDVLRGEERPLLDQDRVRLASAASEIQAMSAHLPFDTSHLRETTAVVHLLRDRLLVLIPVLSSLTDRLEALRGIAPELDPEMRRLLTEVADWISDGAPMGGARVLVDRLERARADMAMGDWYAFNRLSVLLRLGDLVEALSEGHVLLAYVRAPEGPLPRSLAAQVAHAAARPLHSDHGLAIRSGLSAWISVMVCCLVWIGAGWHEGESAAITAAITCSLFAALDDPVPAIRKFGDFLVVSLALGALYLFVLMPAISSFAMLVMVLAPMLLVVGAMMPDPRYAFAGLSIIVNLVNVLVIQDHFQSDFAQFLNLNLSVFFGVFVAVFVTSSLRSMSVEVSARRLIRQTWHQLARLARGQQRDAPVDVASKMVDRLGLLAPKLAAAKRHDLAGVDILTDLRVGMDLVALRELRGRLPAATAADLDRLLSGVGEHYGALSLGEPVADTGMLRQLDRLLERLTDSVSGPGGARGICALVGMRRNLFPEAPGFEPVRDGGAA